jgi:hypothetical protein
MSKSSEYDRFIVLIGDDETGDWSIMHTSKDADSAIDTAQEKRDSGDKSPMILLNTADFINF